MNKANQKIQQQWQSSKILACDGVVYADGSVTLATTYYTYEAQGDNRENNVKYYFSPLVDCTLEGYEKYNDDGWLDVDMYHGSFIHDNQKIVFGSGCMGNEGFVASTTLDGQLNWSMYFDFSNPINKAEVIDDTLVCYGDTGIKVEINLHTLHKVKIHWNNF